MDKLIAVLRATAVDVGPAGDRISHRGSKTATSAIDRELVEAWLTAADTLAALSCDWRNPHLKADGARLHHLTESLRKSIGLSLA